MALPAADAALLRLKGGAKKEKKPDGYEAFQPPKRALTAYMIFSNKIRPELMKANPELKITEVSKHIADKWKALADGDKAALQKQAEALKVAYDKKKAEYEAKVPQEVRQARSVAAKKKKAGKPAKDPNAPKKPLSAFMIFSNKVREDVRAKSPDLSFGETGRKIAEMWNSKTPKEKEPFEKEAVVLREKFLVLKAKYEASKPPVESVEKKPKKDKGDKKDKSNKGVDKKKNK